MPQESFKIRKSDALSSPSKTLLPNFFRVQKPEAMTKAPSPELQKTSWITSVASKVGEGAMALGGNIFRVFQGKKASQSVSAFTGTAGLGALQELALKSEEQMAKAGIEGKETRSLVEAAETIGAAEEAARQSESGRGTITDQGKNAEEDAISKQAEARRKQNFLQQRAAAAESSAGQKKKESFMWKILDLTPGFGEISLLRKVPKVFGNLF